ncbi:hypothetical protein [Heyndrickxia sporothermodurans]|uniref:hypothetical protein n=1 Tax=Heyndrickxia sporothermodurans TaxID=46224 RepID=UPI000D36E877|nr:hypothetical protein [Heyndrickxia sporothermodurans]PTY92874.1 hypothetical protein B5V90_02005 [Heyndrickxia sporothermodurans]
MIDFAISPQGDLIFEEFEEPKSFKIDFRITESKGLNIKFHVLDPNVKQEQSGFKVSFATKQKTGLTHKASLVSETDQKLQQIRIALTTERGELPTRQSIGSRLSLARHQDINDSANLRLIEQYVLEAISGILTSPEVMAKPEKGVGNFYCQTVGIFIYEKGILIFKFYI